MKYLPRDVAFGKLESLVAGAAIVRAETAAGTPARQRNTYSTAGGPSDATQ